MQCADAPYLLRALLRCSRLAPDLLPSLHPPPLHPCTGREQDTKDKFLRLQAEFDNFRKRTAAEKDSLRSAVRGETVEKLLPLVRCEWCCGLRDELAGLLHACVRHRAPLGPPCSLPTRPPRQVDNFELAKQQLKLETEGEKRVDAAYQGLYKQMVELFRGMGLEATPGAAGG